MDGTSVGCYNRREADGRHRPQRPVLGETMSIIHVQQIKAQLVNIFDGLIDLSDYAQASANEREMAFLTRALAAFCLTHLADIKPDVAASSVTDGTHDNGIDAVYYDSVEKILYFVQTKWQSDGRGSLARGDAQKFITGVKDIINARLDRFNAKVQRRSKDILDALYSTQTRLVLVVAYTGQEPLAADVQRDFDDLLLEMNDPSDIVQLRLLRQGSLHSIIASGTLGSPINIEVVLRNWGQIREPYMAYYGQVAVSEVATWWESHHPRLFSPNLRMFLGNTEVNQGIVDTLSAIPENFWYFNNGITALCASIKKKPLGGTSHDSGVFEISELKIVNGAQTVGAIATAYSRSPDKATKAHVMVRFISLESCPPDFANEVTRATNTQNRIERRDFVSLDDQQERIKTELQLDGVIYVYKSGETTKDPLTGFDLIEATVALACSHKDLFYAVQAKREIGKLWEDITKAPYRALFNPSVSGLRLWRLVQMQRAIDSELRIQQEERDGKEKMFPVHGNRFLAYQVYKYLLSGPIDDLTIDISPLLRRVKETTNRATIRTIQATADLFPDSYLASLFKNLTRCRKIDTQIESIW
jgi:AIPR protein